MSDQLTNEQFIRPSPDCELLGRVMAHVDEYNTLYLSTELDGLIPLSVGEARALRAFLDRVLP